MSTTTDVAVREPAGALAIQDGQTTWDPMQLAALGQLGIADAPDGDKQVFLHVSQRTGLDPFARQIYMIERKEKKSERRNGQWVDTFISKWTIQTGIEGWRVIRDRAERRYGVRGIKGRFIYYAPDGSEHKVWVRREPPVAVEMTYTVVEASGREVPYTSVLRFSEYVQTKTVKRDGEDHTVAVAQWATKPTHMIEKCCEADAYRCAFPQDYSGVVLDDAVPSARPEDMSDEELDAAARAVGYRPRVTAEQARQRIQHVRSEVVPPESAPWPGDAQTAPPATPASTHAAPPQAAGEPQGDADGAPRHYRDGDPRNVVLAELERLGVHGEAIGDTLTQLARKPLASVERLNHKQATWFAERLPALAGRDDLEALLATGEVTGNGE